MGKSNREIAAQTHRLSPAVSSPDQTPGLNVLAAADKVKNEMRNSDLGWQRDNSKKEWSKELSTKIIR